MPRRVSSSDRVIVNVSVTVYPIRDVIGTKELAQSRVIISSIVIQQARAIKSLPGVVEAGLPNAPRLHLAPGVEILLAGNVTPTGGGKAHTSQVVAVEVGHGVGAAVPHCHRAAPKGVILFLNPGAVLFPLPQVEGGDAVPAAVDPIGVPVVAILLGNVINPRDT